MRNFLWTMLVSTVGVVFGVSMNTYLYEKQIDEIKQKCQMERNN